VWSREGFFEAASARTSRTTAVPDATASPTVLGTIDLSAAPLSAGAFAAVSQLDRGHVRCAD
jgi:hypothetical protein